MRVGVLTGGGDVPGLNAAIRAVARSAFRHGYEVVGILDGWAGLLHDRMRPLDDQAISGILHMGGTILGASRTNPLHKEDEIAQCVENAQKAKLDAVVAIGGDDTLGVAAGLYDAGLPTVGIPKTMDNDVVGTDYCIGFDTAVTVIADALDRLHTTADAHHRVIVVEVMGRDAGWTAAFGGLAGGADMVLIPERPISVDEICAHITKRYEERNKRFSIIVVAEGAKIYEVKDPDLGDIDAFGHVRLDRRDVGKQVQREIEARLHHECRSVVLGHLQRGGSPTVFDRVLATRLGVRAVDLIKQGWFGQMVALQGNRIVPFPLRDVAGRTKQLDPEFWDLATIFY